MWEYWKHLMTDEGGAKKQKSKLLWEVRHISRETDTVVEKHRKCKTSEVQEINSNWDNSDNRRKYHRTASQYVSKARRNENGQRTGMSH